MLLRNNRWDAPRDSEQAAWGRITSYLRKVRLPSPRGAPSYRYDPLVPIGKGLSHALAVALARSSKGVSQLVVLKGLGAQSPKTSKATERVLFEARLIARMRHPNVVAFHGLCQDHSLPVIAMEFLEGQSLDRVLAQASSIQHFSQAVRIGVICRVLAGLEHVHGLRDLDGHELPISHGAICPGNVMLTYDGQVKLIDFSHATFCQSSLEQGLECRSFPYVAPEQVQQGADQRVDIFSTGVLLWEMLAGVRLWAEVPAAVVHRRLLRGAIPRLREVQPSCDPELDEICARAMAKHPGDRFEGAKEMRAALERYLARNSLSVSNAEIGTAVCSAFLAEKESLQRELRARLTELGFTRKDAAARFGKAKTRPWLGRWRSSLGYGGLFAFGILTGATIAQSASEEAPPDLPLSACLTSVPAQLPAQLPAALQGTRHSSEHSVELVALDVHVDPPQAILYLDGQRLSTNPTAAFVVRDSRVHTLRSEAEGYETFVQSFQLNTDLVIDVRLSPVKQVGHDSDNPRGEARQLEHRVAIAALPIGTPR